MVLPSVDNDQSVDVYTYLDSAHGFTRSATLTVPQNITPDGVLSLEGVSVSWQPSAPTCPLLALAVRVLPDQLTDCILLWMPQRLNATTCGHTQWSYTVLQSPSVDLTPRSVEWLAPSSDVSSTLVVKYLNTTAIYEKEFTLDAEPTFVYDVPLNASTGEVARPRIAQQLPLRPVAFPNTSDVVDTSITQITAMSASTRGSLLSLSVYAVRSFVNTSLRPVIIRRTDIFGAVGSTPPAPSPVPWSPPALDTMSLGLGLG